MGEEEDKKLETIQNTFARNGIPEEPTCGITGGIRFDFCFGLRVTIPKKFGRNVILQIMDMDSGIRSADIMMSPGDYYCSSRHYFVRYAFKLIYADNGEKIFYHEYNATGKEVLIDFPIETMGDNIAWFSCCDEFQKKNSCKLYISMCKHMRELFEPMYPNMKFIDRKESISVYPYAFYTMGIFLEDKCELLAPVDYRCVPLNDYAAYFLGVERGEKPPRISYDEDKVEITEPYVCIASQASGMAKTWLNPNGWVEVISFLKEHGYRVIDIDGSTVQGSGIFWHNIPRDAEDFTGFKPLSERASLLKHADFFIGMPSGLSWLAWCVGVPIVMISGFSMPYNEFYTPYRVQNYNVCHGCFGDMRYKFDPSEYDWCPKQKGTKRHFECTLGITAQMVIDTIKRIPKFINHTNKKVADK